MIPWAPGRPGPAPEEPWQPGTARRLETIGRILDESRDLLDTAMERNTGVEASLRRAEYQTRDLQWDAAKILLDHDPARPAIRTVQAGGEQVPTEVLRHTQAQAEDLRDTLRQARRHLEHATPLVTELTGATTDPEHAVGAAMLATRLERLNTLVELATPLAERTSTRIEQAHQTLTAGLKQTPAILPSGKSLSYGPYPNRDFHRGQPVGQPGTAEVGGRRLAAVRSDDGRVWCPAGDTGDWFALHSRPSTDTYAAGTNPPTEARATAADTPDHDTFHQFWNLDRGILDTARELAHAHASATNGAELTEHAVNATTVTAAHTRDLQRLPGHTPTRPGTYPYPAAPSARPGPPTDGAGPAGPAI